MPDRGHEPPGRGSVGFPVLICCERYLGSLIGRSAHFRVNATRHYTNLFLVIVGNSAHARKGTSWDVVSWLLKAVDPDWHKDRIKSGLASGEGLIWLVRDPITRREKAHSTTGGRGGYHESEIDPGVDDKRALWVETEIRQHPRDPQPRGELPLRMDPQGVRLGRHGLRDQEQCLPRHRRPCLDHRPCHRTRAAPPPDPGGRGQRLRQSLPLALCPPVEVPGRGGRDAHRRLRPDATRLAGVVDFARGQRDSPDGFLVARDHAAKALWQEVYPRLNADHLGAAGQAITRAAALTMRLAVIYALLDASASSARSTSAPPWPSGTTASGRPGSSSATRPAPTPT